MQTAQRPPVPHARLFIVALAGVALILATIGLLAANDTFELPVIGGSESTTVDTRNDAPTWNPPADRGPGASSFSSTDSVRVTTVEGHRYQMYMVEGMPLSGETSSIVAEPAGSVSGSRVLDSPQGEGYPMVVPGDEQPLAPMGEGMPIGLRQ